MPARLSKKRSCSLLRLFFIFLINPVTASIDLYTLSTLLSLSDADHFPQLNLNKQCQKEIIYLNEYMKLPQLSPAFESRKTEYEHLKILALRWDPVQLELRLIAQPVIQDPYQNSFTTLDSALHIFFRSSDQNQFLRQLKKYQTLVPPSQLKKLGIHPHSKILSKKLNPFLCELLQSWSLHKITFMTERRGRVMWHFGGLKVDEKDGIRNFSHSIPIGPQGMGIVDSKNKVSIPSQRIVRVNPRIRAAVHPRGEGAAQLESFFSQTTESLNKESAHKILVASHAIENPLMNTSLSVDCISCHALESAQNFIHRYFQINDQKNKYSLNSQDGSFDHSRSKEVFKDTSNFRIFGYFRNKASIADRVLFESIEIQKYLQML